jgi:hypothetical protein
MVWYNTILAVAQFPLPTSHPRAPMQVKELVIVIVCKNNTTIE